MKSLSIAAFAAVFGYRLHPASRHGGVPGNLDTLGAVAGSHGHRIRRFCPFRDARWFLTSNEGTNHGSQKEQNHADHQPDRHRHRQDHCERPG